MSDARGSRVEGSGEAPPHGVEEVRVELEPDRRDRVVWVVFLAGPVIWFAHFMLVYVVAEAGCTGGGEGLRALDPPVPGVFTLAATAVAAVAALAAAAWAFRRWRDARDGARDVDRVDDAGDDERHGPIALGGFLLSMLSFLTIVGVGVPAAFLPSC